jgi:hypothetical protein
MEQALVNFQELVGGNINHLGAHLKDLEQVECPLTHAFTKDSYARQIIMPAGTIVITKIHKHESIGFVAFGSCDVIDEQGVVINITGPKLFITPAGTQRALHVREDTMWLTFHVTEAMTVEDAEQELVEMPVFMLESGQ